MKIYLVAFVDTNFGDNLFINILTSRYPNATFYIKEKEEYKESYKILLENEKNIVLIGKNTSLDFLAQMDAMFVVGGDMFFDKADYHELICQVKTVKKSGGMVAFLGNSLMKKYCLYTWMDLMVMYSEADVIVVREKETYEQLKKKIPWMYVKAASDMAFSVDVSDVREYAPQTHLLGISVRRKVQKNSQPIYERYCDDVAKIVVQYLEQKMENQVAFLALSRGVFDDAQVADDIKQRCPKEYWDRIQCVDFTGNVKEYMLHMQRCEKLICTRFHALVFSILLGKPFVPIIYEEKMERLLNEIQYCGVRSYYDETICVDEILSGFSSDAFSEKELLSYMEKARHFFDDVDDGLKKGKGNYVVTPSLKWRKKVLCILYTIKHGMYEIYKKCLRPLVKKIRK